VSAVGIFAKYHCAGEIKSRGLPPNCAVSRDPQRHWRR
jgi:hypothetical protein